MSILANSRCTKHEQSSGIVNGHSASFSISIFDPGLTQTWWETEDEDLP